MKEQSEAAQTEYLLKIAHLTKQFDDDNGQEPIIRDLDLALKKNEFLTVLGPSGCGKTTLLRCIAGFESYEGEILIGGAVKTRPGMDTMMVFQDFNQLFPWKNVEKNIQYPLSLSGIRDKAELKKLSDDALARVSLTGYEHFYPHQLSGGMKQRVAIAKAIALKPQLILMDEPFAALDAMTRRNLQKEILEISRQEDCTIIFITHNIQEALTLGTRLLVIQKGGKIAFDSPNPLLKPVTPSTEGYGRLWDQLNAAIYGREQN